MSEFIGQAGTLESNDIMITVQKNDKGKGIDISLTSIVLPQYGPMIREVLENTAKKLGQTDLMITAADKGALSCTIEARLCTALLRAKLIEEEAAYT